MSKAADASALWIIDAKFALIAFYKRTYERTVKQSWSAFCIDYLQTTLMFLRQLCQVLFTIYGERARSLITEESRLTHFISREISLIFTVSKIKTVGNISSAVLRLQSTFQFPPTKEGAAFNLQSQILNCNFLIQ